MTTIDRAEQIIEEAERIASASSPYRIELPFPPSSNTAYPTGKTGKRFLSGRGKEWYEKALPLAEFALQRMDTPERLKMMFMFYFPNNRKCDLNNYVKLPQDVICSVLNIDDNHFVVPIVSMHSMGVDKEFPRCVVYVYAI